jgi:16S rRNA (cytidine1402-2'-O)-methyltransferase
MAGTLYVVATPIGNLEDISARALRVLREVAVIAAEDTRRTAHLLHRFGLTTPTTSFHEHNAKSKAVGLTDRLLAGDDVAVVSDAGTPGISDPGPELVRRARELGIQVVPIPGPSALVSALSVSGFTGDSFVFLGFPPSRGKLRTRWMDRVEASAAITELVVFYEAPHRIDSTLDDLRKRLGAVDVVLARELTKLHEELIFGVLTDLRPPTVRGEFVVVIDIGHSTKFAPANSATTPDRLRSEFCALTEDEGYTRRGAIAALSRRHGLSSRAVFDMLEASKLSAI